MSIVKLADKEINLNPELLKFDEHNINQFLQNFAANYNQYYEHHSDSQYVHSKYEDRYDAVYAEKFKEYREESSSDKMADMRTKADKDVQDALENVRLAKRNVNLIWGYLRSMDRSHEDAMQFCYNLRKELDKLFPNYVKKIEDVIG